MCNAQRLVDYSFVNICAENLNPEHLSERFDLRFSPLDETFRIYIECACSENNRNDSLLATSFSLKLARNQSAVCLIIVKMVIASSLM